MTDLSSDQTATVSGRSWPRVLLTLLALVASAAAAYSIVRAVQGAANNSADFQYSPARMLLEGRDPFAASMAYHDHQIPNPFLLNQNPNYPASGLLMLAPIAALPWPIAWRVWAACNVLFAVASVWLGLRQFLPHLSWPAKLLVGAVFVATQPVYATIYGGQQGLIVLAGFMAAISLQDRWPMLAGVGAAVSWFKYTLGFPLAVTFLLDRRWRLLGAAILVHVVLFGVALLLTGADPIDLFIGPLRVAAYATVHGFVDVTVVSYELLEDSKTWQAAVGELLVVALAAAALRRAGGDLLARLALLAFASLAVIYHYGYDSVVLLLPYLFLVRLLLQRDGLGSVGKLWFGAVVGGSLVYLWWLDAAVPSWIVQRIVEYDPSSTETMIRVWGMARALDFVGFYGSYIAMAATVIVQGRRRLRAGSADSASAGLPFSPGDNGHNRLFPRR